MILQSSKYVFGSPLSLAMKADVLLTVQYRDFFHSLDFDYRHELSKYYTATHNFRALSNTQCQGDIAVTGAPYITKSFGKQSNARALTYSSVNNHKVAVSFVIQDL
jgi:hypothetical protein